MPVEGDPPLRSSAGRSSHAKVIESTLVSVDGVIGDPHQWTGEHFGDEAVARALEQLTRSDAMVMGRRTYEMFSNIWAEPVDDYATAIYSMRKYVFSSTLEDADWNNTAVVRGDVASAVHDLKQQAGQDIVLYGHGPVGQALLEAHLLDELKLWIHPVVVGSGTLLFRDGTKSELELVATETTTTGVVIVTYRAGGRLTPDQRPRATRTWRRGAAAGRSEDPLFIERSLLAVLARATSSRRVSVSAPGRARGRCLAQRA